MIAQVARNGEAGMPYLIDGHNLIGKLPNIALHDIEDERRLLELLTRWCRASGKRATVYFDRGSLLADDPRPHGGVTAHFVRPPMTADDAIRNHLSRLGARALNWTVVSSDRAVRSAAARAGARVVASEEFASALVASGRQAPPEKPEAPSDAEVQRWLDLFRHGEDEDGGA
jgi:predicted RNA-binding protein with PIN domain